MNYWHGNLVILRGIEPEDGEIFHRWNLDSERGGRVSPSARERVMLCEVEKG